MQPARSNVFGKRVTLAASAIALLAAMPLALAQGARPAGTLDRIRETARLRLGYRTDARPFSYKDDAGKAAGYSVALCQAIADDIKTELKLTSLAVEWVPVALDGRFEALQQGTFDLLCAADTVTLARRATVDFSVPIFPGGIGAVTRADAPVRLREVLEGRGQRFQPTWRASASQVLQARSFAAVEGTTGEAWLADRVKDLHIIADVTSVASYDAGLRALVDRKADAVFGERAILLDAARRHPAARNLMPVDRLFSYEPLALALPRSDGDFRLVVDRALSRYYRSGQIAGLYTDAFGEPDESALTFFRWNALPE